MLRAYKPHMLKARLMRAFLLFLYAVKINNKLFDTLCLKVFSNKLSHTTV